MGIKRFLQALAPHIRSPRQRAGIAPGLYHYVREADGEFVRFHLRVDRSGNGLLMANAAAAAQLSVSGVMVAKGLLEGDQSPAIASRLVASFHGVTPEQAAADVAQVRAIIDELASPGDNYPILNLADPSFSPHATPLDKPLSADMPLVRQFSTGPILDRLWELGIPHVTFIADNQIEAAALVGAVERASDLGMITGVRGAGTVLARGTLIRDLATAGLDHLDVGWLSLDKETHDALTQPGDYDQAAKAITMAQEQEICPMAQMALLRPTMKTIEKTLSVLTERGVHNACVFALATTDEQQASGGPLLADELIQTARLVEEAAEALRMRILWFPTVRFDPAVGVAEQVGRGPRCGGDSAIRVEPDGSVIAARGPYRAAGNVLTDSWDAIYQSEVFRRYRRRLETDTHCEQCPGLAICAADCPRNPAGWAESKGLGIGG